MAFNGSGVFSRLYNWVTEQASSPIEIAKLDTQEEDFVTAFNNCLTRDGQGKPTADIDWDGNTITNLGAPSNATDAATKGYVDTSGTFTGTLVGVSGTVTSVCRYAKAGNVATVYINAMNGTGSTTALKVTGLPAAVIPARTLYVAVPDYAVIDNSANVSGGVVAAVSSGSGDISFSKNDSLSGWTASGTKGIAKQFCITYLLT